jgi:hypothetical protein
MRLPTSIALSLCLLAGCVNQGEPSPVFREAQAEFNALYGREVEDAYLSPELPAIEKKLESVPDKSSDKARADELLKRIRSGRERVESNRAERQAEIAAALKPSADFAFTQTEQEQRAKAEPVDAGSAVPAPGMALKEFNARFGDCFGAGEAVLVNNQGLRPTWTLKELPPCRKQFAGFEQKILVGEDEKILAIVDKSRLQVRTVDAGNPNSAE